MGNDKFYVVIGANTNSACEGRIYDYEDALERCEYWSRVNPGTKYYVCETISVTEFGAITKEIA